VTIDYDSPVIEKIVEFWRGYDFNNSKPIPKPLPHAKIDLLITEFDKKFVAGLNEQMICDLLGASKSIGLDA
jgi:hypothetical protein